MLADLHFHLSSNLIGEPVAFTGCLISRSVKENSVCIEYAKEHSFAVGAYTGDVDDAVISKIEAKEAIAYHHIEGLKFLDKTKVRRLFNATLESELPVVVNLNWHENRLTDCRLALEYLDFVTEQFPAARVIIAHLGAEHCFNVVKYAAENPNFHLDISNL